MNHTPGPWKYDYREGMIHGFLVEEDGSTIFCVRVLENSVSHSRLEANLQLIASAPRLAEHVCILRESLLSIAGISSNENSDPDRMADALGEIQGIVRRALEATKERP